MCLMYIYNSIGKAMRNLFYVPIFGLSCIFVLACGKQHHKPYSTWAVNGKDTFRTNEVYYRKDKSETSLYSEGINSFAFSNLGAGVGADAFTPGIHVLSSDNSSHNPDLLHAFFKYYDTAYTPMPFHNDTIEVLLISGKLRYRLYNSWFVNIDNPDDSVSIQGTFNEP